MNILHIANEAVSTGNGIVNSAIDLACVQARAGHRVSFVSSGGGHVDLLERYNVHHFEICQRCRTPIKLAQDLPLLRKILTKISPDVVHAHMMTGAVVTRLGRSFGRFGTYRLVTTIHNEWRLTSNLMRLGDRVIVLSNNAKTVFQKKGFPEHKLRVVRHGIIGSPRRLDEVRKDSSIDGLRNDNPLIVTTAGLYRRKGIGDLMRAFGQIADEFPQASLFVLGWGPERAYFERLRKSVRGGERIHLKGFVEKPHAVLRAADIFVLASHTEAFPLAVAEAREAGCAVVATAVGGVPELLEDGRAGILIPPRDLEALARELRRLLGDRRELARWREAARSNLSWLSCERMNAETTLVYASLLEQKTAPSVAATVPESCSQTITP